MKRKLINLRQKAKTALDAAEAALTANNAAEFDTQMAEADRINGEIQNIERLMAARGEFDDNDSHMVNLHDAQQADRTNSARASRVDALRNDREYVSAWADAIKAGISPARAENVESFAPLTNVLSVSGGSPAGSDGGFLAPLDFDNMLHTYEKEFVDLSTLFASESVTAMSGWRAFATSDTAKKLPKVEESATIGKTAQPSFKKVSYQLSKYGDRLAVSRELLNAEPGVLMNYIAGWFAQRYVATKNDLLIALMNSLTAADTAAGTAMKDMKTALNKKLNTAHSRGASILTNQTGYDVLDQLLDGNNRPMLVPNPADPDTYRFKGKQVIFADDDDIANASSGAAPIYIGKFSAFATLFSRQAIEIASTDIGGDAWTTASPEVRALCFMDAQTIDAKAVTRLAYAASGS